MPATDYQGSSAGFPILGRSILHFGLDHQLHSMETTTTAHPMSLEAELELFQRKVADRLVNLTGSGSDIELLSVSWVRKLLDVFLFCQEEFRSILFNHKALVSKPPVDRMVSEYFERSVKALDVCNAIRDGIEQIRQWQKLLEIVVLALNNNQRALGEGQFRRAKKALIDLAIAMLDDKDSNNHAGLANRNRSFGRNNYRDNYSHNHHNRQLGGHFRSLSWSVSRSWSAMRQLQGIASNIVAPKANEVATTNGLAVAIYTINSVLLFVMWALVAAIPCQDRGLAVHISISRSFSWAGPIMSLHEKIMEESKRKDRKNACGLLREIHQIEKFSRLMSELTDSTTFPLTEEKESEVRQRVKDLSAVCDGIKDGLDPLERQVREVFHRIVRSRTEGLDSFGRMNHYE